MAVKKNTASMVYDLVKPLTDELGLFLWDVRFEKEGASWFLRVYIDSDDGISFDECEAVSRPLSKLLDEKDFIEQSYYLEVGSPGLMRELKTDVHFQVCIGDEVLVKLIRPRDDKREFTGILKEYEKGKFKIVSDDEEIEFNLSDCSFVKLNDDVNL